jgi:hypothetical protein
MKFHSRFAAAVVALGLAFAASPATAACDPETSLFEDEFDFHDVSWGDPDANLYVQDGVFVVDGFSAIVNFSTRNKGANVCVDMTIAEASKIPNSPIGLLFWWQDWDNYYSLVYWADGWMEVRRKVNGEQTTIFSEESLALKKGVGETNNIELDLNPKDATIFINGTKVKRFKGRQPKDGGLVGFYGISEEDAPAIYTYDNLVVNEH